MLQKHFKGKTTLESKKGPLNMAHLLTRGGKNDNSLIIIFKYLYMFVTAVTPSHFVQYGMYKISQPENRGVPFNAPNKQIKTKPIRLLKNTIVLLEA